MKKTEPTAQSLARRAELIRAGICTRCAKSKAEPNRKMCDACHKEMRERRARVRHTPKYKELIRRIVCRKKQQVLDHYGSDCTCCGERNFEFLQVGRAGDDGPIQRCEIRPSGHRLYGWLIKNGFPPGFRILCANCNYAKRFYGICLHEQARQEFDASPVCVSPPPADPINPVTGDPLPWC